jgi:hypothetical protein
MSRAALCLLLALPAGAARAADYDADGLEDADERARGTDVAAPDTDYDGLPDGAEVLLAHPVTDLDATELSGAPGDETDASLAPRRSVHTDPLRQTLLVEIDCDRGACPSVGALRLARRAFADIGVEAWFFVDDAGDWLSGTSARDVDTLEAALAASDGRSGSHALMPYVHVLFTDRGEGELHGLTHSVQPEPTARDRSTPPDATAPRAGALVFSGEIARQREAHAAAFDSLGVSLDQLVARALVHELGHTLGASHEGPANGGWDWSNVMVASSELGAPEDAPHRWSLQFVAGHPRFSPASRAQLHLDFKTSVETSAPLLDRRFAFTHPDGDPSGAPAAAPPGFTPVAPGVGLEWTTGFGFDLHRGGFAVAHLGTAPWRVRLGVAGRDGAAVRCELGEGGPVVEVAATGEELGAAAVLGASPSASPGTEWWARPRFVASPAGFGRSTLTVRCEADTGGAADVSLYWITLEQEDA